MMSSSRAMHLAVCCLIVLIMHTQNSSQESLQRYLAKRQAVLQEEASQRTGGKLKLNPQEVQVNEILMAAKQREFTLAFQGEPFAPSLHFFKSKQLIEKSQVFQIIQKMPKGGALHTHDISVASLDWVIHNATYMDNLYLCLTADDAHATLQFRFFSDPPLIKSSTCTELWENVAKARQKQGSASFDQWLFGKLSMWTEQDPAKLYPNVAAAWLKFTSCLVPINDLISSVEVFQPYLWQAMTEFAQDNVQYMEIRSLLTPLRAANGDVRDRNYSMELYSKTFKQFVADNPQDFSGAKCILSSRRRVPNSTISSDMKLAASLRESFPDHFAGYDLVGPENVGYPLIHFIQDLLLPSQTNRNLPFFFHAGETNWEGTSVDENLIDALLLNTSRIGHGYAVTKHPLVLRMIKDKQVPIAVNPISNQVLGLVSDLRNHPAATLISQGLPVVISSDDPATWGAGPLSYDFYMAFMGLAGEHADLATLKQLAQDSIRFSAMTDGEKAAAMSLWEKKWETFLQDVLSIVQHIKKEF